MCQECGCEEEKTIQVNTSITAVNDALADQIKEHLKEKEVFCLNIMGAPGCGKTTLIESLANSIGAKNIAVIQGDLESDVDKIRLEKNNIATYQINTHSGCHLNAAMINKALLNFPLKNKKYLFIENVGNLVCPAGVQIGQHANIILSATTEGSDKPKKYPIIFSDADAVIITKYDLATILKFNEKQYLEDLLPLIGKKKVFKTTQEADSVKEIVTFISHRREHLLEISHHH